MFLSHVGFRVAASPLQANRAINTLSTPKMHKKEVEALQHRVARCEAAMHLVKRLPNMKASVLHENLLLLADNAADFPLDLRIRIVHRLACDMLGDISKNAHSQPNVAVEDIKRWALLLVPWPCDGQDEAAHDLDPKKPGFRKILDSILALDSPEEEMSQQGEQDEDHYMDLLREAGP